MKKLALLIGINYPNTNNELKGCVNDVRGISKMLVDKFEFNTKDMQLLIDDTATKKNILTGLNYLVDQLAPGDVGVFSYSGHGTQIIDTFPHDEEDMLTEALVPIDSILNPENYLLDDEISKLVLNLRNGVNFTVIFDSCHSGTATRPLNAPTTRYINPTPGTLQTMKILTDLGVKTRNHSLKNLNLNHYLLAACRDDQEAGDDEQNGFLTAAIIGHIKKGMTYEELRDLVVPVVSERRSNLQTPQFYGPDIKLPIFGI